MSGARERSDSNPIYNIQASREPLLPREEPMNIHTWLRGRQMLLLFGERYRARISVYIGMYLAIEMTVIFGIGISLLRLEPHEFNLHVLGHSTILTLILGLMLSLMLLNLVRANIENRHHQLLLCKLRSSIAEEMVAASADDDASLATRQVKITFADTVNVAQADDNSKPPMNRKLKKQRSSLEALEITRELLEVQEHAEPIRLLGVPANVSAMSTIAAGLAITLPIFSQPLYNVLKMHLWYHETASSIEV